MRARARGISDLRACMARYGRIGSGRAEVAARRDRDWGRRHEQCIQFRPAMPHRTPIPHQLNAARGCVGKTEVQSLWRHRGATPQGLPENSKDAVPGPQSRSRRARATAGASARAVSDVSGPEIFDVDAVQDGNDHAPEIPEIQDQDGPGPEIQGPGHPDPDEPGPDVPEPEIPDVPQPEPERPKSPMSN